MRKLLIAEFSDTLRIQLQEVLRSEYAVTVCADGAAALRLLDELRPDALILNLLLPQIDGLTVLEEAKILPPVILCISSLPSDYGLQRATDLGANYILLKPFAMRSVQSHLRHLLAAADAPAHPLRGPQARVATHLTALGIDPWRDGGLHLRIGIPLFAQDPSQRMVKELYPSIVAHCGNCSNAPDVEYTMRDAIQKAWALRNEALWEQYFPGATRYPSNKRFIARLAQLITDEK